MTTTLGQLQSRYGSLMQVRVVEGDLLDQEVEAIVNAWNCNFIPWWLLLPRGVSGAIKKRAGSGPFRELGRLGLLEPGEAVVTGPGRLSHSAIIHVAGLDRLWRSTEKTIRKSTRNVLKVAEERGFASIAIPLIGAGTGGVTPEKSQQWIEEEVVAGNYAGEVVIVRFRP